MPNYQQPYAAKPKNPNILGNTPYEALGGKNELQYYPNLKNRHADNIAKQLEADGVRFSGVRKGFTTTITINKRDIPRYEAAVTKVKAMYSQLNGRTDNSQPYQRQTVGYSALASQYDAPARPQQGRFVSDDPDIIGNTDYRALGNRNEISSPIFSTIAGLIIKLKDASFDFAYEMRSDSGLADVEAEML